MDTAKIEEINRLWDAVFPAKPPQQEPPLILTFGKFAKGDYPDGAHNLYIVWRGKRCLYVGVSRRSIFDRWFVMPACHWNNSSIGMVIARNRPASLRWKIELRHVINLQGWELEKAEAQLIAELKPLYNTMGNSHKKTPKEIRLYNLLLHGTPEYISNYVLTLED